MNADELSRIRTAVVAGLPGQAAALFEALEDAAMVQAAKEVQGLYLIGETDIDDRGHCRIRVRIRDRFGCDWTDRFGELVPALFAAMDADAIRDAWAIACQVRLDKHFPLAETMRHFLDRIAADVASEPLDAQDE